MKQYKICSYFEAVKELENPYWKNVISIVDPMKQHPHTLQDHPRNILKIKCDDICFASSWDKSLIPPTKEQVEQIIEFSHKIKPGEPLLTHCQAGISRSSAAMLIYLATQHGLGKEAQAVEMLCKIKNPNIIFPNSLMIEYADKLLGFNGRLIFETNSYWL